MSEDIKPIPVTIADLRALGEEIRNTAKAFVKPRIKNSVLQTFVIDGAGATPTNPGVRSVQICGYEPNRTRLAIYVQTSVIAVTVDPPILSPDNLAPAGIPQGAYLPAAVGQPYEFYGPDAMWINSILGQVATPVVVVKEYC